MPVLPHADPGRFCWTELATPDASAARAFYGELFGWGSIDVPMDHGGTYTMLHLPSGAVGGMFALEGPMAGMPPCWMSYIAVADADAAAQQVVALGGQVVKGPFDVMDIGRMAVVQDPAGAVFCLWTERRSASGVLVDEPGAAIWNELYSPDPEAAAAFYGRLLGWETAAMDIGAMGTYTLFRQPGAGKDRGGMMALSAELKDVPPHWLVYFAVADCDASCARAAGLGAQAVVAPTDIPGTGRFCVLRDPAGAVFGLFAMAG